MDLLLSTGALLLLGACERHRQGVRSVPLGWDCFLVVASKTHLGSLYGSRRREMVVGKANKGYQEDFEMYYGLIAIVVMHSWFRSADFALYGGEFIIVLDVIT